MIQSLKVRCRDQHDCVGASCYWTGKYGDYWEHIQGEICLGAAPVEAEVGTAAVALAPAPPRLEELMCHSPRPLPKLLELSARELVSGVRPRDRRSQQDHAVMEPLHAKDQCRGASAQDLVDIQNTMLEHTSTVNRASPGEVLQLMFGETRSGIVDANGIALHQKKASKNRARRGRSSTVKNVSFENADFLRLRMAQECQARQWQGKLAAQWQRCRMASEQMVQYQMAAQAYHMQRLCQLQQ
jgi:hypothetical protein